MVYIKKKKYYTKYTNDFRQVIIAYLSNIEISYIGYLYRNTS